MSELKNISPLLDGYSVGNPISEHHGIVCCPAIKENTERKFILKVISIPATPGQLDALLLAGAYKDPAEAMDYYRKISEDILDEAELLKQLSRLDGFLSYEGWQMEPITRRRLGYQIYLVGSYKRSLDKYIRKNAVTHLEAVNLGLDLCSALSVCRQAGYLYVALKPSNIYVSDKKEYRIGDLGFLSLDSLGYAALPERYYGPYTAPELLDPMASVNLTADTYSVGMILYQLYNDGHLPVSQKADTQEPFPMPINADYEMAEIIMKAIHPDPEQRWNEPAEMGKALASYMQRNSINDVPITPFVPLDVKPEDIVVIAEEAKTTDVPENDNNNEAEATDEPTVEEVENHADSKETADDIEEPSEIAKISEKETVDSDDPIDLVEQSPELPVTAETSTEAEPDDIDTLETDSEQENEEIYSDMGISDEVSEIVSHADDLIAHEIPEIAIIADDADPFAFASDDEEDLTDDFEEEEVIPSEETDTGKKDRKKKKNKSFADKTAGKKIAKFFKRLFALVLICLICVAGYWYYENVYLQTIDNISVEGTQDQITVYIDTNVDESSLIVTCSDSFGKVHTGAVSGGKTSFSGLHPSTMYTVEVKMNGFHHLNGKTTQVFTTEATTQVLSFTAVAGSEDGSVMLNFTVDGKEPDFWNIRYVTEGEDVRRDTITTHSTMITGLTIGKVYTFKLDGGTNFELSGETTVDFLASRLVLAEDIVIASENGEDITVSWKTPGDAVVNSWNVRCYNKDGLDSQKTVTENQAQFTGIDPTVNYTIEITAEGMIQPAKAFITADPLNITQFHADESKWKEMKVSWEYSGSDPEGGWILVYTTDGGNSQAIKCEKATAVIPDFIPNTEYRMTVHSADDRSIYNNVFLHRTNVAAAFTEHNIKLDNLQADLLKTPDAEDWYVEDIAPEAFTNTFAPGESVSVALRSSNDIYVPSNETQIMYVFRSSYGSVIPELVSIEKIAWKKIWFGGDHMNGELKIPKTPTVPGEYNLEIYFNGKYVKGLTYIVSQ